VGEEARVHEKNIVSVKMYLKGFFTCITLIQCFEIMIYLILISKTTIIQNML